MAMTKLGRIPTILCLSLLFFHLFHGSSSQKTCSNCGFLEVPYPLSTHPNCGDPDYSLFCDRHSQKLYFDALNGSSYLILRILPSIQRLIVQPTPWLPGGMPSAYKIRLHSSGCRAFRSILHLDTRKPPGKWEEGLEIQWSPPPEPRCTSQSDCSGPSTCSPTAKSGISRCLCNKGYSWDHVQGTCSMKKKMKSSNFSLTLKLSFGVVAFLVFTAVLATVILRRSRRFSYQAKLAKAREETLKLNNGGKSARMFTLREMQKATNKFSKDRILGSGGFGEVYKGELQDGTIVAIKSAKVGDIKSTEQVLNEVGILSQVNHKNLVKLLGCCVEAEQPLMIYEYVSNGTLHDHLHDQRLMGKEPSAHTITSLKIFSDLALACLREKKEERPTMKDVLQELQCIIDMAGQEEGSNVATEAGEFSG
ncbi:hypothetical protein Pfo_028532 [Paulownia fortunei]|nr:hypothetical protein Pfo_028532 [Paulownia fortunei]